MPDPKNQLGRAFKINADAVGKPGNRRFRLLVEAQYGSACLWMEKQQLSALAISIKTHLMFRRQYLSSQATSLLSFRWGNS